MYYRNITSLAAALVLSLAAARGGDDLDLTRRIDRGVAKGWEQVDRIGRRAYWQPRVAVIMGAGPVGLLAALLGVQRGLEVHVFDRVTGGPKPPALVDAARRAPPAAAPPAAEEPAEALA